MPVVHVDTEQSALIEVALVMLEAALTARSARVDPEEIITKALQLQAYKLATVRKLLAMPDPPAYRDLGPTLGKKAREMMAALVDSPADPNANDWWNALRLVINAPDLDPK